MSQTTKQVSELLEQLPEPIRQRIYEFAQAEAKKAGLHPAVSEPKSAKTVLEIAYELGIVGIVKNGPPDLSTHPRHMEGFGQ